MDCALGPALGLVLFLMPGCSTSPRTSPADAAGTPASAQAHASAVVPSGPTGGFAAPPVSATGSIALPPVDNASPPLATIRWIAEDVRYVVDFPTSISERGDRVVAIISVEEAGEIFNPQWLVIKSVHSDKLERVIDVIDWTLADKLMRHCREGPSACIHLHEVQRRVDAANAVLAGDRWRRFPCFLDLGRWRPNRFEAGCDRFRGLKVRFQDSQLTVSHQGRNLVSLKQPTWAYRGASCKEFMRTDIESASFDPETGIYVVGLYFWATVEGCDVPRWDFHPIRLPMLRSKAIHDLDGGTP